MTKENNISKLWKTEDWLACWLDEFKKPLE